MAEASIHHPTAPPRRAWRLRAPRPLSWLLAALAAAGFVVWTLLRTGFGLVPLLGPVERPAEGPRLSWRSALRYRALLAWRWLRGTNHVAHGLAASTVRRIAGELRRQGAPPAASRPVPAFGPGELDVERFRREFLRRAQPVVLRGLLPPRRDWSVTALAERYGDTRLLFDEGDAFRARALADLASPAGRALYVANSEQLLIERPELLADLGLDALASLTGMQSYCAQLFLAGTRRKGLLFHCANNVNLFVMLHGRKRWTFVDPCHSPLMHACPTRGAAYVTSIIDYGDIDPAHFPLFASCPRSEVVLEPGDVLLSPPWWWHRVENLDEETAGCATRWSGPGVADRNPLFSFLQALSPPLVRTLFATTAELLEAGLDLGELYGRERRSGRGVTRIERIAHTDESLTPPALAASVWPAVPAGNDDGR